MGRHQVDERPVIVRTYKRPEIKRYKIAITLQGWRVMRNVYNIDGKKYVIGVAFVFTESCVSITWARMGWGG